MSKMHIPVKIPSPPKDAELDSQYEAMLEERGIPLAVRNERMRIELPHEKWFYVFLNNKFKNMEQLVDAKVAIYHPSLYVDELLAMQNGGPGLILHLLRSISENTAMHSWYWIQDFIEAGGIEALFAFLPDSTVVPKITKSIAIIKVLMGVANYSIGIDRMVCIPGISLRVLLCFDSSSLDLKTRSLHLLQILCCHSNSGHEQVLASFNSFKYLKKEKIRFEKLVYGLKANRFDAAFKTKILSFINVLINSAISLEERVAMRHDFLHQNIMDFFEVYRNLSAKLCALPELEAQMKLFESSYNADKLKTQCNQVDLSSATDVFAALQSRTLHTETYPLLLHTMQHLLFIPCDGKYGRELWQILEKTVAQISTTCLNQEKQQETLSFEEMKALLGLRDKITAMLKSENCKPFNQKLEAISVSPEKAKEETPEIEGKDNQFNVDHSVVVQEPHGKANDILYDERYVRFLRLLKMGMPAEQVKTKMVLAHLDPNLLDIHNVSIAMAVLPSSKDTDALKTSSSEFPDDKILKAASNQLAQV